MEIPGLSLHLPARTLRGSWSGLGPWARLSGQVPILLCPGHAKCPAEVTDTGQCLQRKITVSSWVCCFWGNSLLLTGRQPVEIPQSERSPTSLQFAVQTGRAVLQRVGFQSVFGSEPSHGFLLRSASVPQPLTQPNFYTSLVCATPSVTSEQVYARPRLVCFRSLCLECSLPQAVLHVILQEAFPDLPLYNRLSPPTL